MSGLVNQVFNPGSPSQPATDPPSSGNDANIDDLISSVFNPDQNLNQNRGSTSPGTILGTDNQKNNQPTDCECVPYYQCQNNSILDNGIGLIDIRSGFPDTNDDSNG